MDGATLLQLPRQRFVPLNRWRLLRNVLAATQALTTFTANELTNLDEMAAEIHAKPLKLLPPLSPSITLCEISTHKLSSKLFALIQRSTPHDLAEIQQIIDTHPKKYTRSLADPDYFLNKPNSFGIRPLYEAAKNGYSETVRLLLDNGADPKLTSSTGKTPETALTVASRWGHVLVVKTFLKNSAFSRRELEIARKATKNEAVLKLLKPVNRMWVWCC